MSSRTLSIFVLGFTGYLGGAVSVALKKKYPSHEYIAFTRSQRKVAAIHSVGFKALVGTGNPENDREIITSAASVADIIINAADADDLALANAVIRGIEKSKKKLPILIHTSGTALVISGSTGEFEEDAKIWDDSKVEDIKAIPLDQPHRVVDLAVFNAARSSSFISYMIAPSLIYGVATQNPVHQVTQVIPALVHISIQKRRAVYVGSGKNRWDCVHISDIAQLYVLIFEKALADIKAGYHPPSDPFERFYWGSAYSCAIGDISHGIAPILFQKNLVDTPEAVSVPSIDEFPLVATNSRTVSNRAFREGWKPSGPHLEEVLREDILASLASLGYQ
ncbi:hypothetical protein BS47DRAFT_1294327 [Hydnum rufescens UP504]|uniref:NAD-dependent epimerase/dehydratase domain-containing protein n=1 Tax=Hydnum rufescens UP504 TaxID=1448309 RepID=A0A9P6B154_9AGAM|nr:hypothetical protein BS47DRAFT_1294327 [Hydnum rufescens UP504]